MPCVFWRFFTVVPLACGGGDDDTAAQQEWRQRLVPCPDGETQCLPLQMLTYNVGNGDDEEPHYPLRLSYSGYEAHIAEKIQAFQPDIVFLQEIMSPSHCETHVPDESDPARTCYDWQNRPAAVQRLVGEGYSIVCDTRNHVECMAAKNESVTMLKEADAVAYPAGSFDETGADTPALPMESCIYAEHTCNNDNCDWESTVSAITLNIYGRFPLRAVHLHPNASGFSDEGGFYSGAPCRVAQLNQATDTLVGCIHAQHRGGRFQRHAAPGKRRQRTAVVGRPLLR